MKVKVLAENSVSNNTHSNLKSEHGFSVYIKTGKTRILFDTGKSDLFIRNSKKLNTDLSKVDYLIISHGHFDHGGGLKDFFALNKKAKVYTHRTATNNYFTKVLGLIPYYIGLDREVINNNIDRFVFIEQETTITEIFR